MARHRSNAPPKVTRQPRKQQQSSGAERSALYARREAAKVLHTVLRGDAERRAVASIKSLVFSPSVRNKRGTFALVCETLKCTSFSSLLGQRSSSSIPRQSKSNFDRFLYMMKLCRSWCDKGCSWNR